MIKFIVLAIILIVISLVFHVSLADRDKCYMKREEEGYAAFLCCGGLTGGTKETGYLQEQCIDCPYYVEIKKVEACSMSNNLVNNVNVYGLENSFRVSKFPMQVDVSNCTGEYTERIGTLAGCEKGTGHDNFLKGIIVQFDLSFTIKAWTEGERYHWFDIVSSQSTMHRISKMDYSKCFCAYVTDNTKSEMERLKNIYNDNPTSENYLYLLYNCPVGLILTAGMTTNYQQLKTIYSQRKAHRLPEWREFCKWIETLPYSELITGKQKED